MKNQHIVIDKDGKAFFEEVVKTPVTGVDKLMNALTGSMAVRLPMMAPDLFLIYSGGAFTSFKLITVLTLNCTWSSDEALEGSKSVPFLYPSFGRDSSGSSQESKSYSWVVPKDMALFFVTTKIRDKGYKLMDPSTTDYKYRADENAECGKCGLIAVDLLTGILHRLPLPNVYENASLCTGAMHVHPGFPMTVAEGTFGSWEANRWNADLHEYTKGKYKDLVRLNPNNGKTIAPTGGDWRAWCPKVSVGGWLPTNILDLALDGLTV